MRDEQGDIIPQLYGDDTGAPVPPDARVVPISIAVGVEFIYPQLKTRLEQTRVTPDLVRYCAATLGVTPRQVRLHDHVFTVIVNDGGVIEYAVMDNALACLSTPELTVNAHVYNHMRIIDTLARRAGVNYSGVGLVQLDWGVRVRIDEPRVLYQDDAVVMPLSAWAAYVTDVACDVCDTLASDIDTLAEEIAREACGLPARRHCYGTREVRRTMPPYAVFKAARAAIEEGVLAFCQTLEAPWALQYLSGVGLLDACRYADSNVRAAAFKAAAEAARALKGQSPDA